MQQYVIFAEKHSQSSLLKIKIIEKLKTIAILQVNTEVQHIVYVTYKIILIIKETYSEPSETSETKISYFCKKLYLGGLSGFSMHP